MEDLQLGNLERNISDSGASSGSVGDFDAPGSERDYAQELFIQTHQTITWAFQRHFGLNDEFVCSYDDNRCRSRTHSINERGLDAVRQARSAMVGIEDGLHYSTQFVKDRVATWCNSEGIMLAQEQRERLNSFLEQDDGQRIFGHSDEVVLPQTTGVVLQRGGMEQQMVTHIEMAEIDPQMSDGWDSNSEINELSLVADLDLICAQRTDESGPSTRL